MATAKIDAKFRVKTRRALEETKWDSIGSGGAAKLLRDTDAAITEIHAARLDVGLRIAAKEKQILKQWNVAKMMEMRYLEYDLEQLHKEKRMYERLLSKAEQARAFISARMSEMKVTA